MITSKGHILIANALGKALDIYVSDDYQRGKRAGVKVAIEFVADALAADNKHFDREHFLSSIHGMKGIAESLNKCT
jgi:hypothetical protein